MGLIDENFDEIKEIFFHEFGHYVAFKLSSKEIDGFKISEIVIQKCPLCKNGFSGYTKPYIPKSYKNKGKLSVERLAHLFSNNYFGCLFQILLTNYETHFDICMDEFGQLDNKNSNHFLNIYKLQEKYYSINKHFIDLLAELRNSQTIFFSEDELLSMFEKKNDKIYINMELLAELSNNFILEFEKKYRINIIKLSEIINK